MQRRAFTGVALGLGLCLLAGCAQPGDGEEVWAEVNGRPISRRTVENQFERETRLLAEPLTDEQALSRKLNILQGLIQQAILLQLAAQAELRASDGEVETRLTEERGPLNELEFRQQLEEQGRTLTDIREELRGELSTRKLMDHVVESGQEVGEQEMRDYYEKFKQRFHLVEAQYRVAAILVTPRVNREIRNLGNNDARSSADAQRKIRTLTERLRAGEDFAQLARQYSEDPVTTLSGGDLGFFPESALQETHPSLRAAVRRLETGQWTGPIATPDGIRLIKLLEYEPPGQREFDDPSVQKSIRESLQHARRELLEAAYIEQARNQARVTNYLARQILEARRARP